MGLGIFLYRDNILIWRFEIDNLEPEYYYKASQTFGLLILCFISFTSTYISGTLLTANGNLKILNLLALSSVIVNLILNFILIPILGAVGAAIASLITQLINLIGQFIITFRIIDVKVKYIEFIRIFLFSVLIFTLGYFLQKTNFNWSIQFFLILLIGLMIAFLSGMISIKSIISLLKEKNK